MTNCNYFLIKTQHSSSFRQFVLFQPVATVQKMFLLFLLLDWLEVQFRGVSPSLPMKGKQVKTLAFIINMQISISWSRTPLIQNLHTFGLPTFFLANLKGFNDKPLKMLKFHKLVSHQTAKNITQQENLDLVFCTTLQLFPPT